MNGRLLVYDPVHLAADGSLKVLWDSQRWGVQFLFNKFDPPVIDGVKSTCRTIMAASIFTGWCNKVAKSAWG